MVSPSEATLAENLEATADSEEESKIIRDSMDELIDSLEEEYANQELEKDLGVNFQPVGLAEIEKIRDIVSTAKSGDA